jgi:hypothetical protein
MAHAVVGGNHEHARILMMRYNEVDEGHAYPVFYAHGIILRVGLARFVRQGSWAAVLSEQHCDFRTGTIAQSHV